MSYEIDLQEFCQKHQLPIPVYSTHQITLDPIFESVMCHDGVIYRGQGSTKAMAEHVVAHNVCQNLKSHGIPQRYPNLEAITIDSYRRVYLIDGDNYEVTNETLMTDTTSLFIYFITKHKTRLNPLAHQHRYVNCCVFVSDVMDPLLTKYLGQMAILWGNRPLEYYVVTRDRVEKLMLRYI